MEKLVKQSDGFWQNSRGVAVHMLVNGRPVRYEDGDYNQFVYIAADYAAPTTVEWQGELAVVPREVAGWLIKKAKARRPQDETVEALNTLLSDPVVPLTPEQIAANKTEAEKVEAERIVAEKETEDKRLVDEKASAEKAESNKKASEDASKSGKSSK